VLSDGEMTAALRDSVVRWAIVAEAGLGSWSYKQPSLLQLGNGKLLMGLAREH